MRLWWKELDLQKLVGQRNPKDGAEWLEPHWGVSETIEIKGASAKRLYMLRLLFVCVSVLR